MLNVFGGISTLGVVARSLDLDKTFLVLNIHGPYFDRLAFWNYGMREDCYKETSLIVGGGYQFHSIFR